MQRQQIAAEKESREQLMEKQNKQFECFMELQRQQNQQMQQNQLLLVQQQQQQQGQALISLLAKLVEK